MARKLNASFYSNETLNVMLQVVLLLIERGAEIVPQDVQGNTPLHFASQNGHMESTTLLLIVSDLEQWLVHANL